MESNITQPIYSIGSFKYGTIGKIIIKKYPAEMYYSVYEAVFYGYHIHEKLEREGIENIIINPADIPTSHKEKQRKTDKVDSRKLSRELEMHSLKGIYTKSIRIKIISKIAL